MKKCIMNFLFLLSLSPGAFAYQFDWVKSISGSDEDYGYKVAADLVGNVYVAGYFNSPTLNFNPGGSGGTISNKGGNDGFLVKYDAGGNFLWVKNIGGGDEDNINGVTVDLMGNVWITGTFYSSTIDFNPGGSGGTITNLSAADVFLAKYDGDGNFVWAKGMGGTSTDVGNSVGVDNAGNAYIIGYSSSTDADFNIGGSGGKVTNLGSSDVFLAKYDANGGFRWVKSMGGAGNDYGQTLALDGSANVYITGRYGRPINAQTVSADFNPGGSGGSVTTLGNVDAYIAKYDSAGNFSWVKSMGGVDIDFPTGIAADDVGNVYFTGYSRSATANFNISGTGGSIPKVGTHSGFLAAYDANGAFRWVKSLGGAPGYTQPLAVTLNSLGKVYVSGWLTTPVMDADVQGGNSGTTFPKPGDANNTALFLVEYEASGNFVWGKSIGGSTQSGGSALTPGVQGYSVAIDGRGNLYMTGWFKSNSADFNPGGTGGQLTSVKEDGFLMKFACTDTSSFYITAATCEASYTLNDSIYDVSGTYTQHFMNAAGCDSAVTLELTVTPIEKPVINVNEFVLGIAGNITYASYQWLKENEPIPGATENTLTVTANGDYRVAVTIEGGCADTSDAYGVTNYPVGINNIDMLRHQIHVHPNPATDIIYIKSPVKVNIRITDMAGRLIKEQADAVSVSISELAKGGYLLTISDETGATLKVEKLVKSY